MQDRRSTGERIVVAAALIVVAAFVLAAVGFGTGFIHWPVWQA